ncbi:hypothetical protein GG681_14740, partial [Epibacterium sp. SM1969]
MNTSKSTSHPAATSPGSENAEKDDFSTHLSHNTQNITDDPSRSTLHTGSDHEGDAKSRTIAEGAPHGRFDLSSTQELPTSAGSGITLEGGPVAENISGAAIGTLSIVDPDAGDSHEITLSDDRFEVVGNEIHLKEGVSLNHEEAAEIDLEVTVTDAGGLSTSESFTIAVEDVNEAPAEV